MSHTGVQHTPIGFPRRLKRALAGAVTAMLAAGGLVAITVAAPVVEAPAANAAANFQCSAPGAPTLYATSSVTREIYRIDYTPTAGNTANTAVVTSAYAPSPAIATGTLNQLAISRDGQSVFWTNGTASNSNVYHYTPGGGTGPGTLTSTPRGTTAAQPTGNTMGGFDLASQRYIFGGASLAATPGAPANTFTGTLTANSYNPATPGVAGGVSTITLPNAPGNNGDLAFSPAGTMYVVAGGNSQSTTPSGQQDQAQLYRVTGGIPTSGTSTREAVALGDRIPGIRGLNSIAFGADGYLYLFGQSVSAANPTPTPQIVRVNPEDGSVVARTTISGAPATLTAFGGATDLATCATPYTVRGDVDLDEGRQSPGDQFGVVIGGGSIPENGGGTSGTTVGTGSQTSPPQGTEPNAPTVPPVAGPVVVLPGSEITVVQTPAAGNVTPPSSYSTEWECRNTAFGANTLVSSGFGNQASFTVEPNDAIGSNVLCTFNNIEAVSSVTIDKAVTTPAVTAIGQPIEYSFTVTNTGNVPATGVTVSDPQLANVTCSPAQGTTLNPVSRLGNTIVGAPTSMTCTGSRLATAADFTGTGTVDNTATVSYRTQQTPTGGAPFTASDTASFTPDRSAPAATADTQGGGVIGQPVTVNVVGNDGNAVPGSVTIVGAPGDGKRLEVPNVGVWTVNPDGTITFTPVPDYTGNPPAITYSVAAPNGIRAEASVTVTYAAEAQPHRSDDNVPESTVTVDVLADVVGSVQPGTLGIVTGPNPGDVAQTITVPEGVWSVVDGQIVFDPNDGVTTDPAPIQYQVLSTDGTPTRNSVTVTYQPVANPDTTPPTAPGSPASVAPLANDQGTIDPATFAFLDTAGNPVISPVTGAPATSVTIPNQGTWSQATVDGQLVVTFTPAPGFTSTPTPIGYQIAGPGPDRTPVSSTISAPYLPQAAADSALLQPLTDPATPVVVADILGNDAGDLDPASVQLLDPVTGEYVDGPVTVPGEGTWTVVQNDDGTVDVVFEAAPGFFGDPAPIGYQVVDANDDPTTALITVTFQPVANPDAAGGFQPNANATITPLTNDLGVLLPETFTFLDAAGNPVGQTYPVPGEGVWTAAIEGGVLTVTFDPEDGFEGDPTLVRYQVADGKGATAQSSITFDYDSVGADDVSLNNPPRSTVTLLDVLADDEGEFILDSFTLVPPDGLELEDDGSLVVPGEGTWTVAVVDGAVNVTFTPLPTFLSDPTIIRYSVQPVDLTEDPITPQLIVGYVQVATPDQVLLAPITDPRTPTVVPDILANDLGDIVPASVQLVHPTNGTTVGEGEDLEVENEGTWSFVIVEGEGDAPGTVDVTFTPAPGFQGNPTPIGYQAVDSSYRADPVSSTITITFQPEAFPDSQGNWQLQTPASLAPLANDRGAFDTSTFTFLNPDGSPVGALVDYTNAEGTWSADIDPDTGVLTVTFTPLVDVFFGDPTPVRYAVTGNGGIVVDASITFDYVPAAQPDRVEGIRPGTVATVPNVLGNDQGVFDTTTFAFVPGDEEGELVDGALVVDGQGTWTFVVTPGTGGAPATIDVVFTPEEGFLSDPTPISYTVNDLNGSPTGDGATITVDYFQEANADEVLLAPITVPRTPVAVEDILANDLANLDPTTVSIFVPGSTALFGIGETMLVPGQGTWTATIVAGEDGAPDTVTVTFAPLPSYQGDPDPIGYEAYDADDTRVESTIRVTFQPVANPDSESGFGIGTNATVLPLANDLGEFDATSFAFVPREGQQLQPTGALFVPGEGTWTATPNAETRVVTVEFAPLPEFQGDPQSVDYQVTTTSGLTVGATITVDYQPLAENDTVSGLEPGTVATLPDVLGNDAGVLDPETFAFVPGDEGGVLEGDDLVVDGQGRWSFEIVPSVDGAPATVVVTFAPEDGFLSDPTPVAYTVDDQTGTDTGALLIVDYLQVANPDELLNQPITVPVTVEDILANDLGDFDPESVQLLDPATGAYLEPGESLVIDGVGTWSIVVNADGTVDVTFTPEEGYLGDPLPVTYQALDVAANAFGQATVTVSYLPEANDDEDLANAYGEPVPVDVLANDVGDFDPASVSLFDPAANDGAGAWLEPGVSLEVADQGTWSIDPATGIVTFTPLPGYGGDPDPVQYRVTDSTGDTVEATITVTYGPTAVDDESLRNAQGTAVTVDVLANDLGEFDPTSVRIVDGEELVTTLVVAGEGTWTVDPETGAITFTPASGFTGNPTPITYAVTDVTGDVSQATVTITYLPQANPDRSEGNAPGTPVTVDPLANDAGDLDPTTVEIRDPQTGEWGDTVVVPGEGTWTVDPVTGEVTFTPAPGFTGDPTPIDYRVTDVDGEVTQSTITIDYAQPLIPGVPGLPQTGAEITLWSLIAGLGLLLAGAAVWLIRRRRQEGVDA